MTSERRIAERWKRWRPWALIIAHRAVPPTVDYGEMLELERGRHERLCHRLLVAGLNWKTIDRRSLDDPRLCEQERDSRIASSLKATRRAYRQTIVSHTSKERHANRVRKGN